MCVRFVRGEDLIDFLVCLRLHGRELRQARPQRLDLLLLGRELLLEVFCARWRRWHSARRTRARGLVRAEHQPFLSPTHPPAVPTHPLAVPHLQAAR
jgi:hypothetical protein